jgi:hypothetical protein
MMRLGALRTQVLTHPTNTEIFSKFKPDSYRLDRHLSQFNQEMPTLQILGFTAKIHDEL